MTPESLTGKGLEEEVLRAVRSSSDITGNRYGVTVAIKPGGEMTRIKSLPDLEGVIKPTGRQWNIECKACSSSSLHLAARLHDDRQERQLKHLFSRAEFGAVSMYVIHFNQRTLKQSSVPSQTFAFPVHPCLPYWRRFLENAESKVNPELCMDHAIPCRWIVPARCHTARIDIVSAINYVAAIVDEYQADEVPDWREAPLFKRRKSTRGKFD